MKACIVSIICLLLIAVFLITNALICGAKAEKLQEKAEDAYHLSVQKETESVKETLSALNRDWHAIRPYFARTLHNGYLSPVDTLFDAAEGAIAAGDTQALTVTLSKMRGALETLKNVVGKAYL